MTPGAAAGRAIPDAVSVDLRHVVYELIEKWGDKPREQIRDSDYLLDDIRMDGDDYAMSFVPELEKELGFEAPIDVWESIRTVGDVICVVEKHVPPR